MRTFLLLLLLPILFVSSCFALDRQPNADYHMRRESLAAKTNGGAVLLFAPNESEGPNDLYGYRPDNNFYYLSGWAEPGAALLIVPKAESKPYTEILFLPAHNPGQEKWTGPKLGADSADAPRLTGFDKVEPIDDLRDDLVKLCPQPVGRFTPMCRPLVRRRTRRLRWSGCDGPMHFRSTIRCWMYVHR